MLEGCGDVSAPHASDILPHVAPKDLIERGCLLRITVNSLRQLSPHQVTLLKTFHQISQELMSVLLPTMCEVLADNLQLLIDLHRLDHVGVGGVAQCGCHKTDGARILASKVARVFVASIFQVVDKGRGMEQGLTRVHYKLRFHSKSCIRPLILRIVPVVLN